MDFTLLKKLSEASGVPGSEDELRRIMRAELATLVDEISIDSLGNLAAFKRGQGRRRVMLAAHMDEIGFLVRFIDEHGFLRLQPLGGFDPRVLFAQRVLVHGYGGTTHRGVLTYTAKPTHLLTPEEAKEAPKIENLFVDLGLPAAVVKEKVQLGDMVTMDRTLESCGEHFVGKALDNRVGLFVLVETLRALRRHEVDVLAVATVQEEIGLRGAGTAAFAGEPDVGVALDTTLANDFPGQTEAEAITRLGEGVGIKIMDASLICHPGLVRHFRELATREGIRHQMEILPRGGTDGGALQRTRGGIPSITLSIPTRYIHTVNEMVHRSDVEAAVRLLTRYLEEAHTRDYGYD